MHPNPTPKGAPFYIASDSRTCTGLVLYFSKNRVYKEQPSLIAERATKNYNEGVMRFVAGCLLVALGSLVLPQSSQELRNRYGEPDLERFTARHGIGLTVQYGSDHLACQALIETPQSLIHQEEQAPLMPSEGVSEVLEEFVPVDTRGKQISTASFQSGCNIGALTEFENVSIMRATHECDPSSPNRDARTSITFKRDICPKLNAPFTVNRP